MIISVGVNEYVILNQGHILFHGLATQGLSGCVILAAIDNQKCLLAHLSFESEFTPSVCQTDCLDMALQGFAAPVFYLVSKGTPFGNLCQNGRRIKDYVNFMYNGARLNTEKGNGMIIQKNDANPPQWRAEVYAGWKDHSSWGNSDNAPLNRGTLMPDSGVVKSAPLGEI